MQTIALQDPTDFLCGERTVRVGSDGRLSFPTQSGGEVVGSDLGTSTHAVLWTARGWCCLLGLQSRDVLLISVSREGIVAAGQLERLYLRGGYDPGGLHRVEIHELAGGDILVVHELGLARISPAGIAWQRRHEDITARLTAIVEDVAWLEGESERFGYDLAHGDPRFRTDV